MAFSPDEIQHLNTLADDMIKRIESKETSSEAAVAYGKIGRICTRALAEDAAVAAKRTTKVSNSTKFQTARQNRIQARKGGSLQPQSQGQPAQSRP